MLGLEKRIDAVREMQGSEKTEPHGPARDAANMGIMLALVAIVVAGGVYFAVESKYSDKISNYDNRIAIMEAKVTEAMNAPKDMARKVIVASTLTDVSHKVGTLKGQLDASYQERLAKVEEMLKSIQQDVSK